MRHDRPTSRPRRWRHPVTRGAALAATLAAAVAVVTACVPAPPEPDDAPAPAANVDTSPEGQVSYACALAAEVTASGGDPYGWELFGEDSDLAVTQSAASASLVGSIAGYDLPDHPELSDAGDDLIRGVIAVDADSIVIGLEAMEAACADIDAEGQDASAEGMQAYACALARFVVDERGDVESWGTVGEEPALHEAASVGALLGAVQGAPVPGDAQLTSASADLLQGISRIDLPLVQDGLDGVLEACGG